VIAFWYFKQADDQWLSEKRPEAYFQMAEPDFTLLPVYESMKSYANQPPVMYGGTHEADHWTVKYASGWVFKGGTATYEGSRDWHQTVNFTFEGSALRLEFGAAKPTSYILFLSVDNGFPVMVDTRSDYFDWKGWWGQHSVSIVTTGPVILERYVVTNDLPLFIQMALVAIPILGGTLFALSRKLPETSTAPRKRAP
jgi:hypothetical protein